MRGFLAIGLVEEVIMRRHDDEADGYEQMRRIEDPYASDYPIEGGLANSSLADEDGRNAARRAASSWGAPWISSDDER